MKTNSAPVRLKLAAWLLAAAGMIAGCGKSDGVAKGGTMATVPVQTAVATQEDVPRQIESVGSVQSLRSVAIKSQVDGIIAQIHFKEGDDVSAGDLLVTLDRRPFENAVQQARAALATARAEASQATVDAERYSHLDQQSAISKEAYAQYLTKAETTKADVQSKEAALANAQLQLGYTEIKAPITGRTGQLQLHEGALVKANDNSFTIVSLNQLAPIAVAYSVPEDALPEVRAAIAEHRAAVSVIERTSGVARTDGRLEFVDNTVDPTTGTIVLKATFANTDHVLWPGQFVHVRTQVGLDRGAIVVPAAAVQTGQDSSQVFVMKPDHTVDLRTVTVARTVDDLSLLSSGVQAGETVVTDGQLRLLPGSKVELRTLGSGSGAASTGSATN